MNAGRSGLQAVRAHAQAPAPSVEAVPLRTRPARYWIDVLFLVSPPGEAGDAIEVCSPAGPCQLEFPGGKV